jgi:TusA-related sulfurtransferase
MPETITIDAKGMKCPRPIVELAKAKRLHPPGTHIHIEADDLAFESDVKAWCDTTGNTLDALERDNNLVTAKISLK